MIWEERQSQVGLVLLISRRSCQEVLWELQIWMGKRCFAQSTWIDSKGTIFEKKEAYYVENPKGWPRQKLRQKDPARLKTQKGDLGKRQGQRPWAMWKFLKGRHGKKLHGMEKRKEKKKMMTISKDNKWVVLSLLKLKDNKLFL